MTRTRVRQAVLCAFAVGLVLLGVGLKAQGTQAVVLVLLALLFVVAAQRVGRVR